MSLQQAVALCMDHCDAARVAGDDSWFKTVVLAGGSACLPGLAGTNLLPLALFNFFFCNFTQKLVNKPVLVAYNVKDL